MLEDMKILSILLAEIQKIYKNVQEQYYIFFFNVSLLLLKIVSFLGEVYLIYEYCANGNLCKYLKKYREQFVNHLVNGKYKVTRER